MKRVVAVTGGIACGKSAVALALARLGCEVLDTDEVAHGLESAHGAATPEIARVFGRGVLASDGSVDRRKLGAAVFADPAALARLNAIVHPMVAREIRAWLSSRPDGATCVVVVPLLYEAKLDDCFDWDAVVAVVCPEAEQVRRLCARGFREEEARARIAAQMPCEEKARRADFVIRNGGTFAALGEEVERVLALLPPP